MVLRVEQREQEITSPAPPGPKIEETEPSVQIVICAGGREAKCVLADSNLVTGGSRRELGSER